MKQKVNTDLWNQNNYMMACLRHGIRQHNMLTWLSIFYYFWVETIIYKIQVLEKTSVKHLEMKYVKMGLKQIERKQQQKRFSFNWKGHKHANLQSSVTQEEYFHVSTPCLLPYILMILRTEIPKVLLQACGLTTVTTQGTQLWPIPRFKEPQIQILTKNFYIGFTSVLCVSSLPFHAGTLNPPYIMLVIEMWIIPWTDGAAGVTNNHFPCKFFHVICLLCFLSPWNSSSSAWYFHTFPWFVSYQLTYFL